MTIWFRRISVLLVITLPATTFLLNNSVPKKVLAQSQIAEHFQFPLDYNNYSVKPDAYDFLELTSEGVYHPGEDWNRNNAKCDEDRGDPVYAIANGTVVYAQYDGAFGRIVLIRHTLQDGSTIWSQYAHLDRIDVSTGNVSIGTRIGTMGDSGTDCVHLHFEIRTSNLPADYWPSAGDRDTVYNNYVDPTDFLIYSEITSGVALFEHAFYRGSRYEFRTPGFFNFSDPLNDKASSIAIPHHWTAILFKHRMDRPVDTRERKIFCQNDLDFQNNSFEDGTGLNDQSSAIQIFVPGDANGDGRVDGFDYVVWWQNFRRSTQKGAVNGDFNCNGIVDGFDYVIWWLNFGYGTTATKKFLEGDLTSARKSGSITGWSVLGGPSFDEDPMRIFFDPAQSFLPPDETFRVILETKAYQPIFTQVEISFDHSLVNLTDEIQISDEMGTVIMKSSKDEANSTGRIIIILGASPNNQPPTGILEFAQLSIGVISTSSNQTAYLSIVDQEVQIVGIDVNEIPFVSWPAVINPSTYLPIVNK